ncbi:NAD(P)-dependent oxidoreductase [Variovorax sp. 770b2]|uniref:NAD-dependent epimerase/dehydratase family protein n=1 Tax=Variovorax sp. 770b2 TaxID=1566271 RepID=UPI0008E2EF17|nr:NAD(P)-dependent oxidoreductase [Variovorax sp. 770b2]SFQ26083.1 dTDP-6-deoxy-L-talose 4-dehydrogenase (NAD+) [Variovorax sp. 770b2]
MKIAVTGASGFIGRHVLGLLAATAEERVVAVSHQARDLSWLPKGVAHVSIDLALPPANVYEMLGEPDVLIHLAWSGLPNYQSRHHFETHLGEQYRFLRLLATTGLRSLVCAGTCFEYGMQAGELDESLPTDPRNPYGFAKDALRRELEFLAGDTGLALTWARLFYMHGEGQAPTSLYSQLIAAGQRGDAEFRMSGGEQLRDYLHVRDVAGYLVALAKQAPGAGVVNVCSGEPRSVRSLVEEWREAHRIQARLVLGHFPYPAYEPMAFWGRNAKLEQLLRAN